MIGEDAHDLIAAIVAELHELFCITDLDAYAAGLSRVEELVGDLKASGDSGLARKARQSAYRLPGIVTTDDRPSLRHQLNQEFRSAKTVRIASAFLSGADTNPLVRPLKKLTESGVSVRLLTSVMGFINRPDVLAVSTRRPSS